MGWRLQPEVIGTVLVQVESDLGAMDAAWSPTRLEGVADELGRVGAVGIDVANAVAAVLAAQDARLVSMGSRVTAGLVGVESATGCFEAGQEEMVAELQSQMVASAGSGDLSWWYGSSPPDGAV